MAAPTIDQLLSRLKPGTYVHIFNVWADHPVANAQNDPDFFQFREKIVWLGLVEQFSPHGDGLFTIKLTMKGDIVKNYPGGWDAYQKSEWRKKLLRGVVFYGTFIFAILSVFVPMYCSDQARKQDELMNQILLHRIEEAKKSKNVDSVLEAQQSFKEILQKIDKKDSVLLKKLNELQNQKAAPKKPSKP